MGKEFHIGKAVRVGIIGYGNIGSVHAKWIGDGNVRGLRLTAVCDCDEEKRRLARKHHPGVLVTASWEELLTQSVTDAVVIATPHFLHPQIGIAAFGAKQHVLTEKPIAVSVSEAERLIAAAGKTDRVFAIMFNQRTNSLFQKARELVAEGKLGELKRVVWIITNWYRPQSYYDSGGWRATWAGEGGGVLLNQAPHNLDLLQWICGMPVSLAAHCEVGKYHDIEVEDTAEIFGELSNGARVAFLTTTGEYPGTNRLEISGGLGKLVIEEGRLRWWKSQVPEREYCFHSDAYDGLPKVTLEEFGEGTDSSGHGIILQNFADAILSGTPLIARGEEGVRELMISNAAYYSSWKGREVTVPVDPDTFDEALAQRIQSAGPKGAVRKDMLNFSQTEYQKKWQVNW